MKAKFKEGDKVHYIPFKDCPVNLIENGIIKEFAWNKDAVRVVYNCDGDWTNYQNYTSVLTPLIKVKPGWYGKK